MVAILGAKSIDSVNNPPDDETKCVSCVCYGIAVTFSFPLSFVRFHVMCDSVWFLYVKYTALPMNECLNEIFEVENKYNILHTCWRTHAHTFFFCNCTNLFLDLQQDSISLSLSHSLPVSVWLFYSISRNIPSKSNQFHCTTSTTSYKINAKCVLPTA